MSHPPEPRNVVLLAAAAFSVVYGLPPQPPAPLLLQGVALAADGSRVQIGVGERAAFVPGTSLLQPPAGGAGAAAGTGSLSAALDPVDEGQVARSREWLAAGRVPGRTDRERALAERALLDLRTLTLDDGSVVAAWRSYWRYVWPRDASFAAAAYASTGHPDEAYAVLAALAHGQRADGTFEARWTPGGPVPDDRASQLDANGWVPWAAWLWFAAEPDRAAAEAGLRQLWPMLSAAADAAADALGPDGLPPAGPDYWEVDTDKVLLGVAAPLRTGLRCAADLARALDREAAARGWTRAADELETAIDRDFAAHGYPRAAGGTALDAAVAFTGPPFAPSEPRAARALGTAARALRQPNGGLRPGTGWRDDGEAWTPATALVALAEAAGGRPAAARDRIAWLEAHRTGVGALPERVDASGRPVAVAPLAWTSALVLLTLRALDEPLPVPARPA